MTTPSKYTRTLKGVQVDVYDVLTAFGVTNPATQHAIKKLLMPGQRGAKNALQDLAEAKASVERAIQIEADAMGPEATPISKVPVSHGADVADAIVGSLQNAARAMAAAQDAEVPTTHGPSAYGER